VTILDEEGALIESDQRALVRFVIQDGYGADVVFAAGTTGEWDRVPNGVRQQVIQVCAEEVAKLST
jgi:dihydrodipicolinate synthase/N-acetylneuraminate lyase